jgi:hypothetical protein
MRRSIARTDVRDFHRRQEKAVEIVTHAPTLVELAIGLAHLKAPAQYGPSSGPGIGEVFPSGTVAAWSSPPRAATTTHPIHF